MDKVIENQINKFIKDRFVIERKILSEAFNMRCEKIVLDKDESIIAKYYQKKSSSFNSIVSETKSLLFLSKKFPLLFPQIKYQSEDLLIINFIENNNIKNENYQKILADNILKLHNITNNKYGFEFDAQIGGLQHPNQYETNWVDFFREKRLNMVFEKINHSKPMPDFINKQIEKLLKSLENHIPKNPNISLLHGDLWSGNILFNNDKLVGLIDPGIYFGHNELEIANLTWFNYVDENFLNYYSDFIKIDNYYFGYEPIYQLYTSLLNIHLWSREYIKDTERLLKKIYQTHGLGSDR